MIYKIKVTYVWIVLICMQQHTVSYYSMTTNNNNNNNDDDNINSVCFYNTCIIILIDIHERKVFKYM